MSAIEKSLRDLNASEGYLGNLKLTNIYLGPGYENHKSFI
jgi:hypothetical protein